MKHEIVRGTCPPKRVERSCGRRKNQAALVEVGEPRFITYCPVHSLGVQKEVARLSYAMRRAEPVDRKLLAKVRRQLTKIIRRITVPPAAPEVPLKPRKKVKFVKEKGVSHLIPKATKPVPPMVMLRKKSIPEYSFAALGSRFESLAFQSYLLTCEDALLDGSFNVRAKELYMEDWLYAEVSADPVVRFVAKPRLRASKGKDLVLKPPSVINALLAACEPADFGINHTLRRVADAAESGGFVGYTGSVLGKTFMYVDGQPVLVELDRDKAVQSGEFDPPANVTASQAEFKFSSGFDQRLADAQARDRALFGIPE